MVFIFSKLNALNGMLTSATHWVLGAFDPRFKPTVEKVTTWKKVIDSLHKKTVLKSNLKQN